MDKKIKIFVSYHKDGEILKSQILTPIHVGAAQSSIRLDMQRDDEGDNISVKNEKFCELTAQYWAWKNAEADYYGFMHDKRHFVFREIPDPVEYNGVAVQPRIDEKYKQKIGLSDSEIYACVDGYDVILPVMADASPKEEKNDVQFNSSDDFYGACFDLICQTVLELYPQYEKAVSEFKNGKYSYWYHMFIMKKEIFFDYCQWLFTILEKTETKIDFTYFSEQEMRVLAFMTKRLLGIYMIKLLEDQPELKIKHLKITLLNDTDKLQDIKPAFEKNNIAVAVACNEYYMPILGVMLSTLLANGSQENNYDILVLCNKSQFAGGGITRNIRMLEDLVKKYSNASIRMVDMSKVISTKEFFVWGDYTPEIYFRLFLPQLLKNYEKVLHLDADTIVCHDVAELYKTDLEGALLGAVRDPIIAGYNKLPMCDQRDYLNGLGIKNVFDYFQSGVLLIDLKKMAENDLCNEMIEYALIYDLNLPDQDVLNLFCQGRVKFIDNKWNVDMNSIAMKVVPYAPAAIWKQYVVNRENAYIYHFAGADKPWKNPSLDKADIFWNAARKTSWYEMILGELMRYLALPDDHTEKEKEFVPRQFPPIKLFNRLSAMGLSEKILETIGKREDTYQSFTDGKRVIFYGAGNWCEQILLCFAKLGMDYPAEIWDRAAKPGQSLFDIPVYQPDFGSVKDHDDILCVITIKSKAVFESVKTLFAENGFTNVIGEKELTEMLVKDMRLQLKKEGGYDGV